MRVLIVLFALVATPFVAGVSQGRSDRDTHGVRRSETRSEDVKGHHDADVKRHGDANDDAQECDDDQACDPQPPPPPPLPPPPPPPPPPSSCSNTVISGGGTSIAGLVYNDVTGLGLGGWCIQLTGAVTATAVTTTSGTYSFTGLPGGNYQVCLLGATTQSYPAVPANTTFTCPSGFGGWTATLDGVAQAAPFLWFGTH